MASSSLWQRFQQYFLRYDDLDFSIDISRMKFPDDFFDRMRPKIDQAFAAMRDLKAAAAKNSNTLSPSELAVRRWGRSSSRTRSEQQRMKWTFISSTTPIRTAS